MHLSFREEISKIEDIYDNIRTANSIDFDGKTFCRNDIVLNKEANIKLTIIGFGVSIIDDEPALAIYLDYLPILKKINHTPEFVLAKYFSDKYEILNNVEKIQ